SLPDCRIGPLRWQYSAPHLWVNLPAQRGDLAKQAAVARLQALPPGPAFETPACRPERPPGVRKPFRPLISSSESPRFSRLPPPRTPLPRRRPYCSGRALKAAPPCPAAGLLLRKEARRH